MKVYKFTEQNEYYEYCVLNEEAMSDQLFRDCFAANGQRNDNILDYAPDDTEGLWWHDILTELCELPTFLQDIENQGFDPEDIICDYADLDIQQYAEWAKSEGIELPEDALATIAHWLENNINYMDVMAYTYWDGSNWATLYLEGDLEGDLEEVEIEEAAPILAAVEEAVNSAPYWDGVDHHHQSNGFEVYRTRWTDDPFIARVAIKG